MSKGTLTLVFTGSPSFEAPKRNTPRVGFRFNDRTNSSLDFIKNQFEKHYYRYQIYYTRTGSSIKRPTKNKADTLG